MRTETYIKNKLHNIKNQTYIVTGANSGIGFQIAKILASKGADIILACRNEKRANNAIEELKKICPDRNYYYVNFDQSDFTKIDAFLNEIYAKHAYFDGIILNAGILKPKNEAYTAQGFRMVIGSNLLGPIYTVERLKEHYKGDKKIRKIIFQGSLLAHNEPYENGDLLNTPSENFHAYNLSKEGIESYFYENAKNANDNFIYLLAEPGVCQSNIYNSFPKLLLPIANGFMKLVFHSSEKAALSACQLACNDYKNASYLIPRGIKAVSGFPKEVPYLKINKKHPDLTKDALELVKPYLTN